MKIALLGDVCLNGKFDLSENPNAKTYFQDVAAYLQGFDYVVANLETPLTNRNFTLTCKGLHLKSSTKSVALLKYLHINVVGLANNHMFDYGKKGYEDTLSVLEKNDIHYYGVQGKQVFLEDRCAKVAVGGYNCFSTNPSMCHAKGVNPLDPTSVVEILKKNDKNGYLNLLSVHWGDENIHYPRVDHICTARYFADNVPLILHGHHTHVIQGIERYKGSQLAYSLGNFCTDDVLSTAVKGLKVVQKRANKESFIIALEIENNEVTLYETMPIFDNGEKIELGVSSVKEQLAAYSEALKKPLTDYKTFRKEKMAASTGKKKDFNWFIHRLNYYFIGAVIKGILSQKRYNKVMERMRRETACVQ